MKMLKVFVSIFENVVTDAAADALMLLRWRLLEATLKYTTTKLGVMGNYLVRQQTKLLLWSTSCRDQSQAIPRLFEDSSSGVV